MLSAINRAAGLGGFFAEKPHVSEDSSESAAVVGSPLKCPVTEQSAAREPSYGAVCSL